MFPRMLFLSSLLCTAACGDDGSSGELPDSGIEAPDSGAEAADAALDVDEDNDGFPRSVDCDDSNAEVNPDAEEICDEIDNDCDGDIDDADDSLVGATLYFTDSDRDGYGTGEGGASCLQPPDTATQGGDCQDNDPTVNPGADEVCDKLDNDCDKDIDDADSNLVGGTEFFVDADSDGFGMDGDPVLACQAPFGHVDDNTDCDDSLIAVNPGMSFDFDDDIDNDCDKQIDEDVGSETLSYAVNVQPIWDANCTSCHGGSGGLSLENGLSELLGNSSIGLPYVTPGVPQQSYIWHKLQGTQASVGGNGGQMPLGANPLLSVDLDTINTWISEGALP